MLDFKFLTVNTSAVPTTLAGTPALAVYKANGTTESTAGVTLTVDFDGRTGLNHVRIDTSADGTFYAAGGDYQVVVTAGTVGGTSVVGAVCGEFSIENRTQKADVRKWNGSAVPAPNTAGVPKVDAVLWLGSAPNALISGRVDVNAQATAAALTFNLTGNVTGNLSGSVGSVTGAVGSVTGAVGSVTGNVGGNVVGSVASVTAGVTIANGAITAAAIAAGALNGKGDWLLASGYTAPDNAGIANAATGATRFLTMIVASGLNWTYTADAVKNAPAGGGGGSAIDEDSSITFEDSTVTVG